MSITLLVINTNLAPILHRFRDIAYDRSKMAILIRLPLVFNSPDGGFPWDDPRTIILPRCQQMANVANGVETLPKISIV